MFYKFTEWWTGWMGFGDPRTADLPLVVDPKIPLGLCFAYVLFSTKIGPYLMKDRQPFECKIPMIIYNILQILANVYVCIQLLIARPWLKQLGCFDVDYNNTDPVSMKIVHAAWVFYITKYADFFDTVFMVLRKKDKQISFLHVYHHTGMASGMWVLVKYEIGGCMASLLTLNTIVHAIMYSYYLLTALNPEYKKSIWWKKHITELQLVQFAVLGAIFFYHLVVRTCVFRTFWHALFVVQAIYMFIMFWDFYKKSYLRSGDKKSK